MASEAPQSTHSQSSIDSAVQDIKTSVIEAVQVIFKRAVNSGLEVEDRKKELSDPLPVSGPLQDCEFGMILLLVRDWLGEIPGIPREELRDVVIELVKRTVDRLLVRMETDEGGTTDGRKVFFTGEPYSKYTMNGTKYSANLDAAMITLAFLAPAVELFDAELNEIEFALEGIKLPDWVKSVRDATLYVCLEGLDYALDCRVLNEGGFAGFTSDVESNRARPEDGHLDRAEDRLFFSWTACETIRDMLAWRQSYLDGRHSAPEEAAEQLRPRLAELEDALDDASQWAKDHFLNDIQELTIEDLTPLVREIDPLKGRKLSADQRLSIDRAGNYVHNVYHLSQYAAIRSLVPQRITLDEVRTILDKLDRLVSTSIVGSGLDASDQDALFGALTRKYSLGASNPEKYTDDAYYPLVVRSLSGLLTRTLNDIGQRFSRSEVLALTLTFQRALESHYNSLLKRRPDEEQDSNLWSFAEGQPYVLYATQRTVFGLMQYANFLSEVDRFQKEEPSADKREEELSMFVARRMADQFFRPVIRDLLSQIPTSATVAAGPQGTADADLPLPEQPWANRLLRDWLNSFTSAFKEHQVAATLSQRAQSLILIEKYAKRYEPSNDLPQRKKTSAQGQLESLQHEYDSICEAEIVGPKLSELDEWSEESLTEILFEYLFKRYLQPPATIAELLEDDSTELWKLIQSARGTLDSISNIDTKATVS